MRLLVLLSVCLCAGCVHPGGEDITLYEGALVWDNGDFVARSFAVEGAEFVATRRAGPRSRRVSLAGGFVTPALGNAHHHITGAVDESSRRFTDLGVFYAWNPNSMASLWDEQSREFFARPDTYDVRHALGGITEPRGHPEPLYVDRLSKWVYDGAEREFFVDNAFYYGRNRAEWEAALDHLHESGADFVKIYVLHSEEYARRRDDKQYEGRRGLDPRNVAAIVAAAHARGLPVAAHVETSHDFRVAVDAGVDMLAHLPGYVAQRSAAALEAMRLDRDDAKAAAAAGTMVVPTYFLARSRYDDRTARGTLAEPDLPELHYAVQAENLRLLVDAGVTVLTGTDAGIGIVDELSHLVAIGGLDRAQALEVAFTTGARLIPERRIGRIAPGFSADFLVLDADPRESLSALEQIRTRVKAGVKLATGD